MCDLGTMRYQVKWINIEALFEFIGIKNEPKARNPDT